MSVGNLIEKFRSVALDRVEQMNVLLVSLEREPGDEESVEELLREIHTLKGEAKMMGFADINLVSHQTEHLLILITERNFDVSQSTVDVAFEGMDIIRQLLTKAAGSSDTPVDLAGYVDRVTSVRRQYETEVEDVELPEGVEGAHESDEGDATAGGEELEAGEVADVSSEPDTDKVGEPVGPGAGEASSDGDTRDVRDEAAEAEEMAAAEQAEGGRKPGEESADRGEGDRSLSDSGSWRLAGSGKATRARIGAPRSERDDARRREGGEGRRDSDRLLRLQAGGSMRVELDKLERLGDISGEIVLMSRRLSYQLGDLDEIREELRGWIDERESELSIQKLNAIRTITHQLDAYLTAAREETYMVSSRTGQLDEEVRNLRHVQLAQVMSHYPRAVRDLARDQGKRVRLVHEFGNVEVDRTILSALSEPMLHMIRNAVDHGIEPPEDRVETDKDPEAEIRMVAEYIGDSIRVVIEDDGRGIDPDIVREKAVERGLLERAQANAISDQEALSLIFEPGFSTRDNVSDVSGRGIGMHVVRQRITELGGYIEVESEVGEGSAFILTLPVSSAVSSVLMVSIGGRIFALPSKEIVRVASVPSTELHKAHGGVFLEFEGELIALNDWAKILGTGGERAPTGSLTVLLFERSNQTAAVWVDRVLGEREAMSRPLGEFFSGLRLSRGVALTDSGEVVPLLNLSELFARSQLESQMSPSSLPNRKRLSSVQTSRVKSVQTILVVEDSEITRDLVTGILSNHGYRILTAEDGQEGWERLQDHRVDLVVTDVQMPRMSGLELLQQIRSTPSTEDVPVVILTTLGDPQDKARAMQMGADGYLVKLDFEEKDLVGMVQRYLG
ncbi:MAG: response regulator [Myxococcota bacterium]